MGKKLGTVATRHARIAELHAQGYPYEEIAAQLGLTRQRVGQVVTDLDLPGLAVHVEAIEGGVLVSGPRNTAPDALRGRVVRALSSRGVRVLERKRRAKR